MKSTVCQELFGKRHSELTPEERRRWRNLARKASHYRHHAKNVKRLRDAAHVKKRAVLDALRLPAVCQRCGYDRYVGALDFHHRDPSTKEGEVLYFGLERAIEEAKKCDLICANCHREAHRDDVRGHGGRPRQDDPLLEQYLALTGDQKILDNLSEL